MYNSDKGVQRGYTKRGKIAECIEMRLNIVPTFRVDSLLRTARQYVNTESKYW